MKYNKTTVTIAIIPRLSVFVEKADNNGVAWAKATRRYVNTLCKVSLRKGNDTVTFGLSINPAM